MVGSRIHITKIYNKVINNEKLKNIPTDNESMIKKHALERIKTITAYLKYKSTKYIIQDHERTR